MAYPDIGLVDRSFGSPPRGQDQTALSSWPTDRSSIIAEYSRRERVYLGLSYTQAERRILNLFEAQDVQNRVIAKARRMLRDISFVVDVDASAIATSVLSLQVKKDSGLDPNQTERMRQAGHAVWKRSRVNQHALSWASRGCYLGRWVWEAQTHPSGQAYIVGHDPRHMEVRRDGFGAVTSALLSVDKVGGDGLLDDAGDLALDDTPYRYRRQMTPGEYREFRDSEATSLEVNRLGVVPVSEFVYRDIGRALPMWAGQGYESGLALVDSLLTQLGVVGTRHAAPILKGMGVDPGSGADLTAIDRAAALPEGTDLQWLEPRLDGLRAFIDTADVQVDKLRATLFEFLFTEAGAGASGLALSHRASGFVMKVNPIRQHFYRALALVTSYAVAADMGVAWSSDMDVFEVDGGEPLPMDVEAMAGLYLTLVNQGLLKAEDAIARMQGLGLVPDGDPLEYLESVMADEDSGVATDDKLNGAQIKSAAETVSQVALGALPRDSGIALLKLSFGLSDEEARTVMGSAGTDDFKPATEGGLDMAVLADLEARSAAVVDQPDVEVIE